MSEFAAIFLATTAVAVFTAVPLVRVMSKRLPPGDIRPFIVPLILGLAILAVGSVTAWIADPPIPASPYTCEK